MTEGPIVQIGNPENPEIAVFLPRSVWQSIQDFLAGAAEMEKMGSDEEKEWLAIIALIESRTGLKPQWELIG